MRMDLNFILELFPFHPGIISSRRGVEPPGRFKAFQKTKNLRVGFVPGRDFHMVEVCTFRVARIPGIKLKKKQKEIEGTTKGLKRLTGNETSLPGTKPVYRERT